MAEETCPVLLCLSAAPPVLGSGGLLGGRAWGTPAGSGARPGADLRQTQPQHVSQCRRPERSFRARWLQDAGASAVWGPEAVGACPALPASVSVPRSEFL